MVSLLGVPFADTTLIPKSSSYSLSSPTIWDKTICVSDHQWFLWKCNFEKLAYKVDYSNSYGYDSLNCIFFFNKMFESKSDRIDILWYIKKQKSQNWQMSCISFRCQLLMSISQKLASVTFSLFVGAHHNYVVIRLLPKKDSKSKLIFKVCPKKVRKSFYCPFRIYYYIINKTFYSSKSSHGVSYSIMQEVVHSYIITWFPCLWLVNSLS